MALDGVFGINNALEYDKILAKKIQLIFPNMKTEKRQQT
jgi:hypothetical protein